MRWRLGGGVGIASAHPVTSQVINGDQEKSYFAVLGNFGQEWGKGAREKTSDERLKQLIEPIERRRPSTLERQNLRKSSKIKTHDILGLKMKNSDFL